MPRGYAIVLACFRCNQDWSMWDTRLCSAPKREFWEWYREYSGQVSRRSDLERLASQQLSNDAGVTDQLG